MARPFENKIVAFFKGEGEKEVCLCLREHLGKKTWKRFYLVQDSTVITKEMTRNDARIKFLSIAEDLTKLGES